MRISGFSVFQNNCFDVELHQGDDWRIFFRLRDVNGDLVQLPGAVLYYSVSESFTNPIYKSVVIEKGTDTDPDDLFIDGDGLGVLVLRSGRHCGAFAS